MSDVIADTDVALLTSWESRVCSWVGRQRFANARRLDRDPGEGPPHTTDEHDIRGAHCEFATSILVNRYWRPSIGEIDKPDVGGLVEVRSTTLEMGRLIVKPDDDDHSPFVLIVADMERLRFRFAGWEFGRVAKEWPLVTKHGDPGHYVDQSALASRSELLAWLREAEMEEMMRFAREVLN
jgi:hypothetical protein